MVTTIPNVPTERRQTIPYFYPPAVPKGTEREVIILRSALELSCKNLRQCLLTTWFSFEKTTGVLQLLDDHDTIIVELRKDIDEVMTERRRRYSQLSYRHYEAT